MASSVYLEVVAGPIEGRAFSFDQHDTFLFGRHSACHARLPKDGKVSRHHFLLEVNPPDARLRDLGSLNGTYVNGVKIGGRAQHELPEDVAGRDYPEIDLRHGDQIAVGKTTIRVRIEPPPACSQCQTSVPVDEMHRAEWRQGQLVCAACLPQMTVDHVSVSATSTGTCEQCGRDVSTEVGPGRRGAFHYICRDCRSRLANQESGLKNLVESVVSRLPGTTVSIPYDIGEQIGRGGMGVVHRAQRHTDGKVVAIKLMLARTAVDDDARRGFLREIGVAARLIHSNIVSVFDSGSYGSTFYLAMEFCGEGSLDRLMEQRGGSLPLSVAAPIMLDCLAGLEFAHGQNFVHRDLKPQNILLVRQAAQLRAKLSDFGLAKNFSIAGLSGMTATGQYGGTYNFMPREQITEFKYVRPVSDIWSLGATFYNMLTGRYPLKFGRGRDPLEVILHDDATPILEHQPGLPRRVAAVIDKALATEPAARYPTAAEMRVELGRALS